MSLVLMMILILNAYTKKNGKGTREEDRKKTIYIAYPS